MTRGAISLGRLFGINIRVDWSWLFIFLLITWNLSIVFAQVRPDWGTAFRWGVAAFAAILFFASVLAHELAHSLMARSRGIPVRSITLFLFGGVSNLQQDPETPRSEFLMAIVGPLTSFIIGGILIVVAGALATPGTATPGDPLGALAQMGALPLIFLWLGWINIILGIFNMVPGFPLDGGRVLRSIFWAATNDLRRATRWASGVGQGVAWLMIGVGIAMIFGVQVPFFGTGLIGGVWLAFIGWFLNNAAVQSYQQVVIQDVLEGVPVSRIMRPDPPTVSPGGTVANLVYDHVMRADERAFPVMVNGSVVGLVTVEDVRKVPREQWDAVTIEQIMTPSADLVTVSPTEDAAEALQKLAQRDVNQLPVMDRGQLVGLLRRRDMVRWLQVHAESHPR